MLDEGKGVVQNYGSAFYWYTRAALKDHAEAQFNLADMLSAGRGIDRDVKKAYIWSLIAASNGHKNAVVMRDNLEINLKSKVLLDTQNEAQALDTDIKSGEAIKRFMAEQKQQKGKKKLKPKQKLKKLFKLRNKSINFLINFKVIKKGEAIKRFMRRNNSEAR